MSYYAKRFFGQQQGIVTDGLKLWLDASNPASYPGSGATWYDLSGNGNNGTMVNGVTPLSNAMQFDGVDDYVSIPNLLAYSSVQSHTYCVWINQGNLYAGYKWILNNGNSNTGTSLVLNSSKPAFFYSGGGAIFSSQTILLRNKWHYISAVYNGLSNTIYIYINGTLDSSNYLNKTWDAVVSTYGGLGEWFNSTYKYNGKISDVKVYNKALSPQEILKNYNATKSKYGL